MNKQKLETFKNWFAYYVSGFYKDDDFVNANLKLKQDHTRRVCEQMRYLTKQLGLSESDSLIAETIALFHDAGRFPQFTEYRTFSDAKSVPHGQLAVEVLEENNVLDDIDQRQSTIIREAIRLHAVMEIPEDTDDDITLFARLIRDADKLDIYHLVAVVANQPRSESEQKLMINWFPQDSNYSQQIVDAVGARQPINYNAIKTFNDMKIMQLAWVYDMNFIPTLERVRQKRYLEKMADSLPDSPDIRKIAAQVIEYVENKLNGDCKGKAI